MKLYVWVDPYDVSYGSSLVFAIAGSVEEARLMAAKGNAYAYGKHSQPIPMQASKLKEPTRIVDLPCAEWHEWSE